MDIQADLIEMIDDLFMEDISDIMDEDLYNAGILDSMGTVELIVAMEEKFGIKVPVSELGRDDWNTGNKIVAGIKGLKNA
ncbi:D-alanine--poly(phosphoribitol) ligase subunit DltC [Periweissella ghanensis]|uniref:D-alanyl carrier protein n=1 Tax=Periweissella ghanensis TaxID=467997 RepID=A0ABN8BM41_9LACO|nr:D-alanine--poly(phosphoribitol) ligase subunit DltC [Periweissella ghanensis]MCM0600867.1 D-alanine--poly(phosphoribitol) ligase subunit DltC [Periweissella ghanensis]CAH0417716.1 D-alanyl carrier protein [Periweissella ghanensis]